MEGTDTGHSIACKSNTNDRIEQEKAKKIDAVRVIFIMGQCRQGSSGSLKWW